MKLFHLFFLAAAAIANSNAQAPDVGAAPNPVPNPEATLSYIHGAWDTLTRSMTDCHSLVDIKITANPVLYVPAEMTVPAELKAVEEKCHVKVVALPGALRSWETCVPRNCARPGFSICPTPMWFPADASTKCMGGTVTSLFWTGSRPSGGIGQGHGG